jgi:type IV pilus assembly protein PilF
MNALSPERLLGLSRDSSGVASRGFSHWLARCAAVFGVLLLAACASQEVGKNKSFDTPGNALESDERKRAKIRVELAVNYFQQKQGKIALDEVNNALAADASFSDAHVLKGLILMEANQNAAAEDSFKQALKIAPNDPDANNSYGWFLCQTGRAAQSYALFNKAAATPFYATPAKSLQNAGICASQEKNFALAESYLLRAQGLDPSLLSAQFHLAQVYLKTNDAARATAYSQKLLAAFKPTAETLWLGIRAAHLSRNEPSKAQLAKLLKDEFITSPQWGLFVQNRFDEQ